MPFACQTDTLRPLARDSEDQTRALEAASPPQWPAAAIPCRSESKKPDPEESFGGRAVILQDAMKMQLSFPKAPMHHHQSGNESGTTRKRPHCCYCKNHQVMSSTRQHRCKYKEKCICILCQLTKKAQIIMCHQQRVWRYQNQQLTNHPSINGQKCDNCRNHFEYVKKSNHECPRKHCDCKLCKLTFKRREIMKHIQRARRMNATLPSKIQTSEDSRDAETPRESPQRDSINKEMTTLCNDTEVEMLVSATNSFSMLESSVSTPSSSPQESKVTPSSPGRPNVSSSPAAVSRYPQDGGKNAPYLNKNQILKHSHSYLADRRSENANSSCEEKESNLPAQDVSCFRENATTEIMTSKIKQCSIVSPLEERAARKKIRSLSSVSPPFAVSNNVLLNQSQEEDVKSLFFQRGNFGASHEDRLRSQLPLGELPNCCRNPPPLPMFSDSVVDPPYMPLGGYPHSLPLFYPSCLEPQPSRQTVYRPRPINPRNPAFAASRTNQSQLLFHTEWFLSSLNSPLQSLFSLNSRGPANAPSSFPTQEDLRAAMLHYSTRTSAPAIGWQANPSF